MKRYLIPSLLALFVVTAGVFAPRLAPVVFPRHARTATVTTPITHVIVMVQENRTIDNLFNGYPGANTVKAGLNALGNQQNLVPLCVVGCGIDPDHTHAGFVKDYNNNKINGFDLACPGSPCYSSTFAFAPAADTQIYFGLASNNVLADSMFQMNQGPSYAAHIFLIAASGGYPVSVSDNERGGAGCSGPPTSVNAQDLTSNMPYTTSIVNACVELPTIMDLLDTAGVSWRYYNPGQPGYPLSGLWTAPYYVRHMWNNLATRAKVVSPETQVLSDIQAGQLPQVSYVIPSMADSDHPQPIVAGQDPQGGPHWVASVVNAVGQSAYWNNTVILLTWDDWGGFFDHVSPPIISANSYGFRVPLVAISAYPKAAGMVDHTIRSNASVITFIERIFALGYIGGPTANKLDARTDDLSSMFDFTQSPRPYHSVAMTSKVRWSVMHHPAKGPDDQ